jgi:hypothetical protein
MREAERQDAEDERRRQSGSTLFGYRPSTIGGAAPLMQTEAFGSDSDIPINIGSFCGGFMLDFSYGGDPNALSRARNGSLSDVKSCSQPVSLSGSLQRLTGQISESESNKYGDTIHPLPPFSQALVDAFGTGGLIDLSASRDESLSYNEGDEAHGEPPEMFYHPTSGTGRPLPPPPSGEPRHFCSSPNARPSSKLEPTMTASVQIRENAVSTKTARARVPVTPPTAYVDYLKSMETPRCPRGATAKASQDRQGDRAATKTVRYAATRGRGWTSLRRPR